jgi:hypothetical protein
VINCCKFSIIFTVTPTKIFVKKWWWVSKNPFRCVDFKNQNMPEISSFSLRTFLGAFCHKCKLAFFKSTKNYNFFYLCLVYFKGKKFPTFPWIALVIFGTHFFTCCLEIWYIVYHPFSTNANNVPNPACWNSLKE